MRWIKIKRLETKIKVKFNNKSLLKQALTHSSYANEVENSPDNERLEFLGDAIIGLLMGHYLYNKGYKKEGEMSKMRAQAVCEEALFKYAEYIDLSKYILLGKGSEQSNARENPAIIADAYEALFGAVYLDLGFEETERLFSRIVVPYLDEVKDIKDYKSTLQEFVQTERKNISYHLESESGPSHNKTFKVSVKVDNLTLGTGTAKTKKEAEQNAAKKALSILAKE